MKSLLPSLKENQRYVVFEIDKNLGKTALKEINMEILRFIGEINYARAGIQVIPEAFDGKTGIVRTNAKHVNEVKMALGLIEEINNKKVKINPTGVSGTLNKAKIKFMEAD